MINWHVPVPVSGPWGRWTGRYTQFDDVSCLNSLKISVCMSNKPLYLYLLTGNVPLNNMFANVCSFSDTQKCAPLLTHQLDTSPLKTNNIHDDVLWCNFFSHPELQRQSLPPSSIWATFYVYSCIDHISNIDIQNFLNIKHTNKMICDDCAHSR